MYYWKRLPVSLFFLMVVIILVGGTVAQAAPTKIKAMWNSATVSLYEKIIPLFNQEYPDIEVELIGVAFDDLPSKTLLAMIDPKGDYDIVLNNEPAKYILEGLLTDFHSLGEFDWDDFYPGALVEAEWEGGIYGAPIRLNTLGLVYNKKFFRQHGIPEPDDDFNLEEFEQAAQTFTTGDKYGFATWYKRERLLANPWAGLLFSHGGKILDDNYYPVFNDKAGVKALEQIVRYLEYGPPGMSNWDINEAHEACKQELVGMIFTWSSSFYPVAADPELTIPGKTGDGEFAPLPKGDVRRGSSAGVWLLCIPENAPNKEEAWTFVKWACSESTQRKLIELGQQSARISLCTDPEYLSQNRGFKGLAQTWEVIGEGEMYWPRIPERTAIQDILAEAISMSINNMLTPQQALDNAAADIQKLLAKEEYYK